MIEDTELLRRFAANPDYEEPFAELVRRRLDLVYSAALRQVGGDSHRAKDIAQIVFCELARKAGPLSRHPALIGWLYTATRYTAANMLRTEGSRQRREEEAQAMTEIHSTTSSHADWEQLRPVLDETMHQLDENERQAILLRFFDRAPLASIGARLGISENAAQKRVDRTLDKLREQLNRRGITSTSSALAIALSERSVIAAPNGLATAIAAGALSTSNVATVGAGAGAAGLGARLFMTTNTKLLTAGLAILAALGIGTAVNEWRPRQIPPATAAVGAASKPSAKADAQLRAATGRADELEQVLENARAATEKAATAVKAAAADLAERQELATRPEPTGIPAGALFNWGPALANFDPDQQGGVARLLAQFETGPGGTDWNSLFRDYSPANAAEAQAILEAFRIDYGTALKRYVGDDGYAGILRYRQSSELQIRQLVTQTANQSGEALSDTNRERLISVILAGSETDPLMGDPNRFNTLYDLAAIRAQAGLFLSPAQMNVLTARIVERSTASFSALAEMTKQGEVTAKARGLLATTPAR